MTKSLPKLFSVIACLLIITNSTVKAAENLNINLFYSNTCPHCESEIEYLTLLEEKYDWLTVTKYEVHDKQSSDLFEKVSNELEAESNYIPFLVIGHKYMIGFDENNENLKKMLEKEITTAYENSAEDLVANINNNLGSESTETVPQEDSQITVGSTGDDDSLEIEVPIIGKINSKEVSLPFFTLVIALFDGFNPCAMWVLLFLISMLLGMKDRRRMWILGSTFIIASGLVYFLFLTAWLNFFLFLGYAGIVQFLIGLLATAIGIYYIYDFNKNKDGGCKVTGDEKRKKVFEEIKKITLRDNILWAMAGMILLAFAVNVVELFCSAGLPAVYTKLLSMTSMSHLKYYLYLVAYVVIFMIDDIAIFVTAMITLKATGMQTKYARFSHLIGGILMLLIGILMLFKPEILMFG